jgi:mycofactocin precursor
VLGIKATGPLAACPGRAAFRIQEDREMELEDDCKCQNDIEQKNQPDQDIIEEIEIEELAVDGICGVY